MLKIVICPQTLDMQAPGLLIEKQRYSETQHVQIESFSSCFCCKPACNHFSSYIISLTAAHSNHGSAAARHAFSTRSAATGPTRACLPPPLFCSHSTVVDASHYCYEQRIEI
jgi:hypothetical protein